MPLSSLGSGAVSPSSDRSHNCNDSSTEKSKGTRFRDSCRTGAEGAFGEEHMPGLSGSGMKFNVHLPLVGRMSLNCTSSFVSEATLPSVEAKTFPVVSNSESKAGVVPSYVFPSMVTGEKLEIKTWLVMPLGSATGPGQKSKHPMPPYPENEMLGPLN